MQSRPEETNNQNKANTYKGPPAYDISALKNESCGGLTKSGFPITIFVLLWTEKKKERKHRTRKNERETKIRKKEGREEEDIKKRGKGGEKKEQKDRKKEKSE